MRARVWLGLLATGFFFAACPRLAEAAKPGAPAPEPAAASEEEDESGEGEEGDEEDPTSTSTEDTQSAAKKPAGSTAKVPKSLSPYLQAVLMGDRAFVKGERNEAIDAYTEAVEADPDEPLAYCRLAEAQLVEGRLDEASTQLVAALAKDAPEPLHATALFLTAVLRERQHKWKAAKSAWSDYAAYLGKAKAPGHDKANGASVARDRMELLDEKLRNDDAYKAVKERMEKRRAELEKTAAENAKKDAQGR